MALTYVFEIAFLIFLLLGIIFSFVLNNLFLQGVTIFIFGIIAATVKKLKKFDLNFPYVLLIVGFVLGYLISSGSGHRLLMIFLFFLGIICGIFIKKIVKTHVQRRK